MGAQPEHLRRLCPVCGIEKIAEKKAKVCGKCRYRPGWHLPPEKQIMAAVAACPPSESLHDALVRRLKHQRATVRELAAACAVTPGKALDGLLELQAKGINVYEQDGAWSFEKLPPSGALADAAAYLSRPDGSYRFGFISDTHLGSKYARLDVLDDLYRRFAAAHVDRVFHAGNWIEGEAPFNRYTLDVHGSEAQLALMVKRYPHAEGIVTYAIAGDDHEGWVCQREGVDIGRAAESAMRTAGRTDWVNLGYMEAFVPLQHAVTGRTSMLHVTHPGGGSAYATSYAVQKLAEAYEGGEKPAVCIVGHYHKMELLNSRNVWFIQAGCTKDADPWSRKKRLENAIGGGICDLEQDGETGAIVGCAVRFFRYFNREYANGRWSHSGPVTLPQRTVA